MAKDMLRGYQIKGRLRPPRATDEHRVCAAKACDTVLSRYNRRDHCYAHAPTRFPRLRGRVVTDG